MQTCLIDVRCLQDPNFRERGIGRHARALLAGARAGLPGMHLTGLVDPELPDLGDDTRSLVDQVGSLSYTGAMTGRCRFVQMSPMTHDPLAVARLLHSAAIPCATVVYDFIPLDEPDRYLPNPGARLDYQVSLRWLARHQLFLPISEDAGSRLRAVLQVPKCRIAVTGAPLAAAFEGLAPGAARHVLVVAGADPRKNPECAVRGHARSRAMQEAGVPLIITGQYPAEWVEQQREIAAGLGGDPDLVQAPGHVSEPALLDLYRQAWCVVAPSRAEGFSLPVVEAMAAGVPVLASDIPAHRELLERTLFGPDDDRALAAMLDRVQDPAWRGATLERQAGVWPRFRESEVARRFWAAVDLLAPERPPASVEGRARVALLTPLPPDRSGVADYSAAMCAELGRRVDLHVFTLTPDAVRPEGAISVEPLSAVPFLSSRFDRVVAVLGNSVFHLEILKLLLRYGGAAILHDGRMLDLYAGHMTMARTVALARSELGRALHPDEVRRWLAGHAAPAALILGDIAATAAPMMMHSQAAIAEVSHRYGVQAQHLPFALYRTIEEAALTPEARAAARGRIGLAAGDVLLASFGHVHPTKAPVDCIWALDLLRSWGVPARLHFVGGPLMDTGPLRALIDMLGLGPHVRLSDDFIDEQTYRDHLIGADIGLQLRPGGVGSVSGALADCIASGLRTVTSRTLAAALDAPGFVAGLPDNPSPVLVAEAAATLLQTQATDAMRRAYVASHGFDVYTARLCQALGLS